MSKLKSPIALQTAFSEYTLHEQIGEGGTGRVFGGTDDSGGRVAVKVLTQPSTDKRRRFKNEIAFLANNKHPNIVTVTDYGISASGTAKGPFYVMRRYDGSLRDLMSKKLLPDRVPKLISQMLDGVEAAHLLKVTHRDLKPENFLFENAGNALAVADFGIASFAQENLLTLVETGPQQRLANFVYAAPEQRVRNQTVMAAADIYALGLMINEMFTGNVPHGTDYLQIASVAKEFSFLDPIVAQMIKQNPTERPASIMEVKRLIQHHQAEAVNLQKLSQISQVVIPAGSVDEPLAHEPPRLLAANYDGGALTLTLDRRVNNEWVQAFQNMGSYRSVMGADPRQFSFSGTIAKLPVGSYNEHSIQTIIDNFKSWLPTATNVLRHRLEEQMRQLEVRRREQLRAERELQERLLRVNSALRV